jgi:hypothetical protein
MRDKFYDGFVGYGELTEMDREFLRPDFDRKRQMGKELAVGQRAGVGKGDKLQQRVDSACLEGDDIP